MVNVIGEFIITFNTTKFLESRVYETHVEQYSKHLVARSILNLAQFSLLVKINRNEYHAIHLYRH